MVAKAYKIIKLYFFIFSIALLCINHASANYVIVQDAEIEDMLRGYTEPLYKAAGLHPEDLKIYLIQDNTINAFATSGNRIFVYSGLILNAKSYTEVVGVLAHETAHIAGGHLVRLYDNLAVAGRNSLISTILGGIAAIASGRADVGVAVAMGGSDVAQKSFLHYRRSEENIADRIAVDILNKTDGSIQGLLDMMKTLQTQERFVNTHNNYLSTHPISSDRIAFLENEIKANGGGKIDQEKQKQFVIIQTKLAAFTGDPDKILEILKGDSYAERYGRAIAYFRKHEIKKSLAEIDSLIKDYPNIAYLYELKGQVLFENGRVKESIAPYKKAYELNPHHLIRLSLAQAEIEQGDKKDLENARDALKKIIMMDRDNSSAYRYLAIASGKLDDLPHAAYYMAEYNFIIKRYKLALEQAERAEKGIKMGTVTWQRLMDIIDISKKQIKKQERKN